MPPPLLPLPQWPEMLDIVAAGLAVNRVPFLLVRDKSKDFGRAGPVSEFKTSPSKRLLLMPLGMGAEGLDLICANHVFLLEPICNPAQEAQAVNRCHRIGQQRRVYVHKMVVQGTVEERILQTQDRRGGGARHADLPSPKKDRAGSKGKSHKAADQSNLTLEDLTFCLRGEGEGEGTAQTLEDASGGTS